MNKSGFFLFVLAAMLVGTASAQTCDSVSRVDWILGEWETTSPRNKTVEVWKQVSPDTFEGYGTVTRIETGEVRSHESLRMAEMTGSVFYIAKPRQNEFPTGFKLVSCSDEEAVFENMTHDFPKRMRYVPVGTDSLHIDVSDGGQNGFSLRLARSSSK